MSKFDKDGGRKGDEGMDWNEVRRRLKASWSALDEGKDLSDKEKQAILKARAREAAVKREEPFSQDSIEIVKFRLAFEEYGIETAFIREIYPLKEFTPLPGVPPFVLGIINIRGRILSVLDLKKFFNLPEKGLGDLNKVIVLRNDLMEFGILADMILGTQYIPKDTVQTKPAALEGIGAGFLKGVAGDGTIILDADKILGDKKIIVNQET